jgi:hypothetical protein
MAATLAWPSPWKVSFARMAALTSKMQNVTPKDVIWSSMRPFCRHLGLWVKISTQGFNQNKIITYHFVKEIFYLGILNNKNHTCVHVYFFSLLNK